MAGACARTGSMRLAEYDGKTILRRHGIAVPDGVLLQGGDEPPPSASEWSGFVLKAQVLEGGRGKRGLAKKAKTLDEVRAARRAILAALNNATAQLLLEET